MRRRLRQVRWREWKRVRTKLRNLRKLEVPYGKALGWANSRLGSWQVAAAPILQVALPNAYWTGLGLRGSATATAHAGGLANRLMQARMSGGVGGGGATPPPPDNPSGGAQSRPK